MPQLAFCHNCNAEVHLIRRPVIQSPQSPSQQFELEEVCPRCTQNCFEYIDDQQQQQPSTNNSNRQQSQFPFTGMNPFNPFSFLQMLDPIQAMVGGIPGMGLFGGLNGANDNDLPAILRLIEQREMAGQSPTDPAVLASLKHIPVTAEWIHNEKKKQRDEKIAREQLEMHEKLQQQGIESDIPITPTIPPSTENNNQDEIIDESDDITLPDCKICLCEPEIGEELIQLPCNHLFHTPCLESWAKGHNTCPTCRFKLPLHLENSTQTQTLPNGTQIRISTHHIDLTTPNAANPDQFNASFFGPRGITQRLTIDSHDGRSVESSAGTPVQLANARLNNNNNNNTTNSNSSQTPIITTATANSNTNTDTNTTNSNLQSTMINGARHIPQPDGSTVIIDRTGIRIRAPDGSTRLIGTQHTLSQISAQNNNNNNSTPHDQSTSNNTSVTTTMNDSQPQSPTLSSKSNPQTASQLTLNTATPPVRKGTGGGVYGQRFQRLPSSANTTTPATATSMTDSTTNHSSTTDTNVQLTSPTITSPSLTSPQPRSNPFKKNFRPK